MSALHHIPHRTKKLPPLRVGIGGPVGSGKTTLLEMLCKAMRAQYDLVAITNDIYTKEDQRLLTVSGALPAERIMGVEIALVFGPARIGEVKHSLAAIEAAWENLGYEVLVKWGAGLRRTVEWYSQA